MDQDQFTDEQRAALLVGRLRQFGRLAVDGADMVVSGLTRLSAGASRRTFSFDLTIGNDAAKGLILTQQVPPNVDPARLAVEVNALRAAAAHGVPVATVVDSADETTVLGAPYLITQRVDGESIPRRILRGSEFAGARETLAHRLGEVAATIHAIPVSEVPGLEITDPLQTVLDLYASIDEPRPAIEMGLRWLRRHRPGAGHPPALVHGDFRLGNLLITSEGLQAVLDWEAVHGGDPYEDLGWLCVKAWRFGMVPAVAGVGTRAELLAGYVAAGGTAPDPAVLHWWEVLGTLRWAVVCRLQARRYELGLETSIDFAMLGRKVCEQEYDLLAAIGLPGRPDTDSGVALCRVSPEHSAQGSETPDDLQDWPSASELIVAVRRALAESGGRASGRDGYLAKVADNALGVIERELQWAADHRDEHCAGLKALGCDTERDLAIGIRDGLIDVDGDLLCAHMWTTVRHRLLVANPGFDLGTAPGDLKSAPVTAGV